MRRVLAVTVGVLAALAGALPAQAKVEGTAYVSGSGIGRPSGGSGSGGSGGSGSGTIKMDGSDGGGYPVMAGLLEDGARAMPEAPTAALGPRYTVRFDVRFPKGQPSLVQYLYPFARGGPLVYTPPGQEWIGGADGTAPSGWFRMLPELLAELQERGLPATSSAAPGAPGAAARPEPSTGPAPVVWVSVLAVGLLLAGTLARRRGAAVRPAA